MNIAMVEHAANRLSRLIDWRRGALTDANSDGVFDTVTTANRTQSWTLDSLGNWAADRTGNTYATNKENQYTSITSSSSTNSLNYGYDNDGNLITRPDPSGFGNGSYIPDTFQFDAWDRLAHF